MYKIGDLSRCLGLTVKTLRYWSDIGLLIPDEIDRFTGYRYYSPAKLAEAGRIITLKELGFSLDEIARFSSGDKSAIIEAKTAELKALADETARKLARLAELKANLTEGNYMIDIIFTPANGLRAKLIRRIFKDRAEALDELEKLAETAKPDAKRIIINYDLACRDTDLDLAVGVEAENGTPIEFPTENRVVGIQIACAITCEDKLDSAYSALTARLNDDWQSIGPYLELYHSDGTVELKLAALKLTDETVFPPESVAPFENDPEALGKWSLLDILDCREQFVYGVRKSEHDMWNKELYFLTGGEGYWIYPGWTEGVLYTVFGHDRRILGNHYTIEELDGHTLMFIEMKACRDSRGRTSGVPIIYVYEKLDSVARSSNEISIVDDVDLPFIPDARVSGRWKVRDFYSEWNPEQFDPERQNRGNAQLFVRSIELTESECIMTTRSSTTTLVKTRGFIINRRSKTASAYELVSLDGHEYLLMQWKSGDYTFGGRINMYVFERDDVK